MIYFNFKCEG